MLASEIMTRGVVTVPPRASILEAMRLMLGQHISGLPVTDDYGRLVGILTEGDLLRRAETGTEKDRSKWRNFLRGPERQAQDYVHSHGRTVDEVMTRTVVTVTETTPLDELVEIMETRHVKRLPVMTDDHVVGVVSRADLLRVLVKTMEQDPQDAAASDPVLRERVIAELRKQSWGGIDRVTIVVVDAVVYLEGFTSDERYRSALRVAAENVPGVKSVCDHLEYFNSNYGFMYVA